MDDVTSVFFLILIPLSSVTALFVPDFGLCPKGIETMADFDMTQVSERNYMTFYNLNLMKCTPIGV